MPKILLVDDDESVRETLSVMLEREGYVPVLAHTGESGFEKALTLKPELVLVDLRLPGMSGVELCRQLRAANVSIPIIVLSGIGEEVDKVLLLEIGADDYVVKPFGMAELLARAHAAMRRSVRRASGDPVVRAGPLAVDLLTRNVTLDGKRISLTRKEYRLLQVLGQHAGNVVTHQQLLKEVWGAGHVHFTQYLRILVRKLRHKIEADPARPSIVVTELGVGYRLAQREPAPTVRRIDAVCA